eukprot:CAMPEP_0182519102 /NCGR_PEP_ID=MMETSP1321-20130603/44921_1 /TAXON_ID=91990 /ORGANISM="Bolidomonas sp., Strain RCC1657" /LENGTH=53 /DNA_ID=CAMNT_0024727059 /DNA_START=1074 /DNA_END=1235 /DNA_ORIENTATION=+
MEEEGGREEESGEGTKEEEEATLVDEFCSSFVQNGAPLGGSKSNVGVDCVDEP